MHATWKKKSLIAQKEKCSLVGERVFCDFNKITLQSNKVYVVHFQQSSFCFISLFRETSRLFCLFRKTVRSGGAFLTYKSLQYKLTVHLALQTNAEDYATLAFIPGLLLHDFQLSSSLSGSVKKKLL